LIGIALVIAIVSSNSAERAAFAGLCQNRGWPHAACESVRSLRALLRHLRPNVVLMRNKLEDGYSDDILAALQAAGLLPETKTVVLMSAGTASAHEARQVALGADCVHRDPARVDVLSEYLTRYRRTAVSDRRATADHATAPTFAFAGAIVHSLERKITYRGRTVRLTPRELAFVELLAERRNEVASYHLLYAELLGRQFAGDTSNMRVLLGKLDSTLRAVGIRVRRWIEVIPKSGYRYTAPRPRSRRPQR
jgi:DNA-binding response OmpR family regulator